MKMEPPERVHTIYHAGPMGTFQKTIRLNLKAVRDLLGRNVAHFDALTPQDKTELEYRFSVYCMHGQPDWNQGDEDAGIPPTINNLPSAHAITLARAVQYNPSL